MRQTSVSQLSREERALMAMMAAGVTFVMGYTIMRVGLTQSPTLTMPPIGQSQVAPHEGGMWGSALL
jgi:hypothetical protein